MVTLAEGYTTQENVFPSLSNHQVPIVPQGREGLHEYRPPPHDVVHVITATVSIAARLCLEDRHFQHSTLPPALTFFLPSFA